MIREAITTAEVVIGGATLWAGALGGAATLALVVVLAAGLPLGVWARLPRPGRQAAACGPETDSQDSRVAEVAPDPSSGRTEPRRSPSWSEH